MIKLILKLFIIIVFTLIVSFCFIILKEKNEKKPMEKKLIIRKSAVAGSFYPKEKDVLLKKIDHFLTEAKKIDLPYNLRVLIVPHAGIDYSGQVAALGFKQIQKKNYKKIILLGASHHFYFDYAAISSSSFWETPLGKVKIDEDLRQKFFDKKEKIIIDENPHLVEHDLEVELIFLQRVLKEFKILPILVSHPWEELVKNLAKKIAQNFDEETLLIVSTDLSHYPPYQIANQVDKATIDAILTGKRREFEEKIKTLESKNLHGLDTAICGYEAIRIALAFNEQMGGFASRLFFYQNSGDTSGNLAAVVGYASIGFYGILKNNWLSFDDKTKKEALFIARKTLVDYFEKNKITPLPPQSSHLFQKAGVFVTLRKNGKLRGCIGEFEPKPLFTQLQEVVLKSAFFDPRFSPLTKEEVAEIKIEISILSSPKKINDWKKIKLGKHGVIVEGYGRKGVFLPQVAQETGWSLEEFLSHLCVKKAGLSPDCYCDPEVSLLVFEVISFAEK